MPDSSKPKSKYSIFADRHDPTGVKNYQYLRDRIERYEGWRPSPYLDTAGIPTIGVGFNIGNEREFQKLPILTGKDKKPATPEEKARFYKEILKIKAGTTGRQEANRKLNAYLAGHPIFMDDSAIGDELRRRITIAWIKARDKEHLNEEGHLKAGVWEGLTLAQKAVLADLAYMGVAVHPKLNRALNKGDIGAAARETIVGSFPKDKRGGLESHAATFNRWRVTGNCADMLGLPLGKSGLPSDPTKAYQIIVPYLRGHSALLSAGARNWMRVLESRMSGESQKEYSPPPPGTGGDGGSTLLTPRRPPAATPLDSGAPGSQRDFPGRTRRAQDIGDRRKRQQREREEFHRKLRLLYPGPASRS